jgi:hypothetical protein
VQGIGIGDRAQVHAADRSGGGTLRPTTAVIHFLLAYSLAEGIGPFVVRRPALEPHLAPAARAAA